MAEQQKDVIFRRINGRIVPIRRNKNKADRRKNLAAIGAGVGTSLAAGVTAGRETTKFFAATDRAETFGQWAKEYAPGSKKQKLSIKRAGQELKKARRSRFIASSALIGGSAIGATLIGAGVNREFNKDDTFTGDFLAQGAGLGASLLLARGMKSRFGGGKNIYELIKRVRKRRTGK